MEEALDLSSDRLLNDDDDDDDKPVYKESIVKNKGNSKQVIYLVYSVYVTDKLTVTKKYKCR